MILVYVIDRNMPQLNFYLFDLMINTHIIIIIIYYCDPIHLIGQKYTYCMMETVAETLVVTPYEVCNLEIIIHASYFSPQFCIPVVLICKVLQWK